MARVELDTDPYDELLILQREDPTLADSVDDILDDLEDEADAPYLRRTYLRPPGLYKVLVRTAAGYADYMVLWDMDGDTVVIRYIGRDFANR